MRGQSADQKINFFVNVAAVGNKRAEGQTYTQVLSAIRRVCAELSQTNRKAIKAGDDFSARLRFERDVTANPGGKRCWLPSLTFCSGGAQAAMTSGMGVKRIELVFRQRPVAPPKLYRDIVK